MCVCQFVCLSVNLLAATYLVCKFKLWCYTIPYGIPNACIVWIPLKTLYSPVLASFTDGKLLDFFPSSTQGSVYTKGHVPHCCSTCIQVPRFSFREKKISGLEWGSNPHTHISGVMLYQLSYQALGRKGIQVLVLGAHYIRK